MSAIRKRRERRRRRDVAPRQAERGSERESERVAATARPAAAVSREAATRLRSARGNAETQKILRADIERSGDKPAKLPDGPYHGSRRKNPKMDAWQEKQNYFGPPIFKQYGRNKKLWAPLYRIIEVFWIKNSGDQGGIKFAGAGEKAAARRLIDALTTPQEKSIIRERIKGMGDAGLMEALFVEFSKEYPRAKRQGDKEWSKTDFRLYHEWGAAHFGLAKKPFAYWSNARG